jgi:DNA-binding PucR family transcriptional regulator
MAHIPAVSTSTFDRMAEIASRVEADLESVVADMDEVIIGTIPVLGADAAIAAETSASSRANVRRYLTVARQAAERPPVEVPPEALDFARTVVRRGIESDAVYQGYRRGQQALWRRWLAVAEQVTTSGAELAAVLDVSLDLLFTYVDEVLGRVIVEMQREREAVLGGALARRAETVRLILDGAPVDLAAASQRLRYELARHHTAIVVWSESADTPQGTLEGSAIALGRAVGARQPLTLAVGTTTMWAWIGSDRPALSGDLPAALGDTEPHVRVAVGPTRNGVAGFRDSHEGALSIQRLVAGNAESERVVTYDELEISALAAQDRRRANDFLSSTLGRLAEDTPVANRLRETLRVFLEEAEHAPRAAARLHMHRNTVLQRVARATEMLGFRPGERRLAVELALELRRRLGYAQQPGAR